MCGPPAPRHHHSFCGHSYEAEQPAVFLRFIINLLLTATLLKWEPPAVLLGFIFNLLVNILPNVGTTRGPPALHHQPSPCGYSYEVGTTCGPHTFHQKKPFVNILSKPGTTIGPPMLHHQPSCCEHSSKLELPALLLHFIINLLLANTLMKWEPPTVLLRFINILIVNTLPKQEPPAVCFIINFHRLIQHHLQSNIVLSPCSNCFA